MAYGLSPSTLSATTEKTQLNQSVTVTKDPLDPAITSVAVTKGSNTAGNIVITAATSSFTITGQYYENWDQTIVYEEAVQSGNTWANAAVTVTNWSAISANLNFVSGYTAATTPSTKIATYYVLVNGTSNISLTQTINNNYTPGALSLVEYVAKGKV
jgi:hypothetical protein